jgi:cytochrome c
MTRLTVYLRMIPLLLASIVVCSLSSVARATDLDGAKLFRNACQTCHSAKAGEAHRQGPNLFGIFERLSGQAPGFQYSAALSSANLVWTEENLERWLADPQGLIPGNVMAYVQRNPDRRKALIDYLKTLK